MKRCDPWLSFRFIFGSALLLFASLGVSELIRNAVQGFMPDLYIGRISLLYIPFGVQVVLAWMVGWVSLLITFPTTLLYILVRGWFPFGPDALLRALLSTLAAPVSMTLARRLGIALDPGSADGRTWSRLLFVGIFGAVLAQFFRYARDCCGTVTPAEQMQGMFLSVLSHLAGLVLVLVALMLWFRWSRTGATLSRD